MSDLIGKSLGRYYILEQIGEGGMATVYKAHDTRLEADVAVKVIRTERMAPEILQRALKRFEREAKTLARLNHPNIIRITDYGEHEGKPYLVMPYFPRGSLKKRLGKPIPWQEALQLTLPIARALDNAHRQNMIHRDVKPSNILMTADGEPMLTDFGIAKVLDLDETADLTGTGMGIGTPEYMAPEQWQGNTSTQSDLYSLGVVLYEMITGRKPYTANTPAALLLKQANDPLPRPSEFVRDLPDKVEKILLRALAKEPNERYKDVGEFIKALDDDLKSDKAPTERSMQQPVQTPFRKTSANQGGEKRVVEGTRPTQTAAPKKNHGYANVGQSIGKRNRYALLPASIILGLGALIFGVYLFNDYKTASSSSTLQLLPASTGESPITETPVTTKIISTDTPAVTSSPTALPEEIVDEKGISMRLVPTGEFTMGNNNGNDDQRPEHNIYLKSFYIDTYEVTNALYETCVNANVCKIPLYNEKYSSFYNYGNSYYANYPVTFVDWYQAATYCEWRESRLPTEAEWEKASRGTNNRIYPWGNDFSCRYGNFGEWVTIYVKGMGYITAYGRECDGYTNTAPVGTYSNGQSPYGVFDMAGNVKEWVSSLYMPYPFNPADGREDFSSTNNRVLRGGAWHSLSGGILSASRDASDPMYSGNDVGIRCARSIP